VKMKRGGDSEKQKTAPPVAAAKCEPTRSQWRTLENRNKSAKAKMRAPRYPRMHLVVEQTSAMISIPEQLRAVMSVKFEGGMLSQLLLS